MKMTKLTLSDLEEDQQEILEKTDITNLAKYCIELKSYQDEIADLEEKIKYKKEKADKISSEIIPNMLAEQGLSSLKLADGSSVDVAKAYFCTVKKDEIESAHNWLRENGLGDIIKNEVSISFGKGEDDKAEHMFSLAEQEGYDPEQKQSVPSSTLKALFRERIEAGLDMPSQYFNVFVKDQTKIGRK